MKKAFLRAGAIILISNVVVTTQVGPVTSWNTTKVVEAKKKKATKVYITPTGSKYHLRAYGRGHYYKVKLSDAKARGLTKCKKCYR